MVNLIERYIHEVGRNLPQKDRAEVEAELRSLIQDKLDDRYPSPHTEAQIASVLVEMGDPRKMAVSYSRDQYLIGPELYPFMMRVLQRGWLLVPSIVVLVHIVGVFIDGQTPTIIGLVVETVFAALQGLFIFSGIVVLIFAIVERSGEDVTMPKEAFDPLKLPPVDDASRVDRLEAAFGAAIGTLFGVIMLYFISVGGLTLRFNITDPSEVIPVAREWMALFAATSFGMAAIALVALRRNRWNLGLYTLQTVLEFVGAIALYFAVFKPFFERLFETAPQLREVPIFGNIAELFLAGTLVVTLASDGYKLIGLWNSQRDSHPA
jgi:hypothetical protein